MLRNAYTLIILLISIKCNLAKNISYDIGEGEYALIIDFPHVVNVNRKCGASILNQRIMLTTAHCVCKKSFCDNTDDNDILVFTGHADKEQGNISLLLDFKMHEKYQPHEMLNDIALLLLQRPLQFGKSVQRVILQRRPPNEKAEIAGWGASNEEDFFQSRWLKFITQRILNRETCIAQLCQIPPGTFCARHPGGLLLRGDAGSALVVRRHIQIGIASHVVREKSRRIAVYTNVSHFMPWIRQATKELYCKHEK